MLNQKQIDSYRNKKNSPQKYLMKIMKIICNEKIKTSEKKQ